MRTPTVLEWAGRERAFALPLQRLRELEEATGAAFATVYLRLCTGGFYVKDVQETLRLALIGGGEDPVKAKALVREHLEGGAMIDHAQIAAAVISTVMTGAEQTAPRSESAAAAEAIKFSDISQVCRVFNLSPEELGRMHYADFCNMMAGYAAATKRKPEPPTQEEFEAMVARTQWATEPKVAT